MLGRCWYCAEDDVDLTDEHVLSEANFGGRLVAPDAVCQRCNSKAGELENLLAGSVGVAELVGRHGRLINRRKPPRPQTDGIYDDRAEVTVRHDAGGLSVQNMKPRRIGVDPDGTEIWEVAEGQEERFAVRRRKRGEKVRAVGRPLEVEGGMNVKYGIGLKTFDLWPRMGAKVALSLASIVFAPGWIGARGAKALQWGFHAGKWDSRYYPDGVPWLFNELPPDDETAALLQSGEHLVGLAGGDPGQAWMILFGSLAYALPVFDAPIPDEGYGWLLSPEGTEQQPRPEAELLETLRRRRDRLPPDGCRSGQPASSP
jgi:hypothetical protein